MIFRILLEYLLFCRSGNFLKSGKENAEKKRAEHNCHQPKLRPLNTAQTLKKRKNQNKTWPFPYTPVT